MSFIYKTLVLAMPNACLSSPPAKTQNAAQEEFYAAPFLHLMKWGEMAGIKTVSYKGILKLV